MSNETNHYKVGDVLDFQQEGKEHIKVLLVDRHTNGMFIGFSVDSLRELRPMNEENSNRGGYYASDLCKYLNSNEFMNIIPDKLRDRVEAVRIPFVEEMFGQNDDYELLTSRKQLELMKARRNRIAFQGCDSYDRCWYWLMNKKKDSASDFALVDSSGDAENSTASNFCSVRPVFLLDFTKENNIDTEKRKKKMTDKESMVDLVGKPATLEQLAEECAELGKAALKTARIIRNENPTPVTMIEADASLLEEWTDVYQVAFCELGLIPDHEQMYRKSKRLRERIGWRQKNE